jgi:hypothetical protein
MKTMRASPTPTKAKIRSPRGNGAVGPNDGNVSDRLEDDALIRPTP